MVWYEGKLSPQYIGPKEISKRVCNVAYELELPEELTTVHPVFHVSMLKCLGDPSLIEQTENVGMKDSLSYKQNPIQIVDRSQVQTKRSCISQFPLEK